MTYVVNGVEVPQMMTWDNTIGLGSDKAFEFDPFDAANEGNCTSGDVIIRALDGHEVTRLPPPACEGTWLTFQ